ncbi:MAG TPA: elongation factor P [Candidatus Paceibacterota bacterium]|nr:elongation factor P [Candidatus Paceibacterota bacterium]
MAVLAYNEITAKKIINYNDEPYEVLSSWVFRKQKRKPVNQVKMRSLKTGSMAEATFHASDKAEEAEVETRPMTFIYHRGDEWIFCPVGKPGERIPVPSSAVGEAGRFLKGSEQVDTVWFDEQLIQVRVPVKAELKVVEAPPSTRGNTAQGGTKLVTLETGATVTTPLFIETGDVIRINTETGTYVERA